MSPFRRLSKNRHRNFYSSGVESAVIEDGFTSVPQRMFDSCKKLTEVTLPESIEVISASAFADCVSLKDIGELPTLKKVETCAFSGCRELTRIYIGSEDTTITAGTYYGCDTLVEVVIPARIKMSKQSLSHTAQGSKA